MTRAEHLAWCKTRALAYVDAGDIDNAFMSLISDLRKHPETNNHTVFELGMMLRVGGHLHSEHDMRDFINGCN